ncbi:MAG: PilW family protein [Acidimicrobiia bacterium]
MIRRLGDRDDGVGLVELMVSLLITAVLSVMMLSWVSAVNRAETFDEQDDLALQNLRVAKERLTKELRFARQIQFGDDHKITIWQDDDYDGVQETGEVVTWEIGTDGSLTRSTDAGDSYIEASELVYAQSLFGYDATPTTDSTTVTIDLVADVDAGDGPNARSLRTQVHLRNA